MKKSIYEAAVTICAKRRAMRQYQRQRIINLKLAAGACNLCGSPEGYCLSKPFDNRSGQATRPYAGCPRGYDDST